MVEKYKITTYNEGDREREWSCVTLKGEPINDEDLVDLLNSQSAEIAGLREACQGILAATEGKKLNNYDRISVPASALITLHEALGNPSEIPNSSEVRDAAEGG